MKKAKVTQAVVVALLASLLVMPGLGGCAKPAPAPAPAPKPAPAPTQAAAPAPKAGPLAQIIEGAKKEGTVTVTLVSSFVTPKLVQEMERGIKEAYGVDLKINAQGIASMAAEISKAIMEHKSGVPSTYDVINIGNDYTSRAGEAGIFEKVDWRPLLAPGTPAEVLFKEPRLDFGPVTSSTVLGLLYNPQKFPFAQTPKNLNELADPKWKGKLALHDFTSYWGLWAFKLGKDRVESSLRSILTKAAPMMDGFTPLNTRYLAGELDLVFGIGSYVTENTNRGKPTAWRPLDIVTVRDQQMMVMKGARHPNAAKLFAIWFAGPGGAKLNIESVGYGTRVYPNNIAHDQISLAKKEGVPVYTLEDFPGLLDFTLSSQYDQWQKDIKLIIDTRK